MSRFIGFFFSVVFISLTASSAAKLKVPKVQFNDAFKHKILAQTKPELLEKRGNLSKLRRYYIDQLGTERFQYGFADYLCRGSRCEQIGQPTGLKLYGYCKGFSRNGQPNCHSLISVRVDIEDPTNGNRYENRREWYACDDYGSPCRDYDELNEYPSRYTNEDGEFGLNF